MFRFRFHVTRVTCNRASCPMICQSRKHGKRFFTAEKNAKKTVGNRLACSKKPANPKTFSHGNTEARKKAGIIKPRRTPRTEKNVGSLLAATALWRGSLSVIFGFISRVAGGCLVGYIAWSYSPYKSSRTFTLVFIASCALVMGGFGAWLTGASGRDSLRPETT